MSTSPLGGVVAPVDHPAQLAQGVSGRPAGRPRVGVFLRRLQQEPDHHHPPQAVGDGRDVAGQPDGVGHQDRVGVQLMPSALDELLEVGAAYFLLGLPDEMEVDGHPRAHREVGR